MYYSVIDRSTAVFKRWGRKGYSLFSVLQKVVKISVLAVVYFMAVPLRAVPAEADTAKVEMQYDLDEIEVTASRAPVLFSQLPRVLSVITKQEIERAPVGNIQDLLEYVAAIDVRQRGPEGVQADISIRGGTFDQTLILLNGVNVSDPQTGHHNFNLPVSLSQVERIEILRGAGARIFGPDAFSGAINIITKQPGETALSAHLSGGRFGYMNSDLTGGFSTGAVDHSLSGGYSRSDGYTENTDFSNRMLFYSGRYLNTAGHLSLQAGISSKDFGANSFYTPKYPNQFEETATLFSSIRWESSSKLHLSPLVYWRRHYDTFMLFRSGAPDWYMNHNYHRTDAWGGSLNSWFRWRGGKTALGMEYRMEMILSNVLGEPLHRSVPVSGAQADYTHGKNRAASSFFLEHSVQINRLTLNAGAMVNNTTGFGWSLFPGMDLSYQAGSVMKVVASWNRSLRMPTFTDLYYAGPTNTGNPGLEPEEAVSVDGGIKINGRGVAGHLIIFRHRGDHLIDWVREPEDMVWRSMNHTAITSRGADMNLAWYPRILYGGQWPEKVSIGFLYNELSKSDGGLISYYVLDHLKSKVVLSATHTLYKGVMLDVKITGQNRMGSFTLFRDGAPAEEVPYGSFWLIDTKLLYPIYNFSVNLSVNNLLNRQYYDVGNVVQPGRWLKAGISYHLKNE